MCCGSTINSEDGLELPDAPPFLNGLLGVLAGAGGLLPLTGLAATCVLPLPVGGVGFRRADADLGNVCGARLGVGPFGDRAMINVSYLRHKRHVCGASQHPVRYQSSREPGTWSAGFSDTSQNAATLIAV